MSTQEKDRINEPEAITVDHMMGSVNQPKLVHPVEVQTDYCTYELDLGLGYHVHVRLPMDKLTRVSINATFSSPENLHLDGFYLNDRFLITQNLKIRIITSLDRRNQPRLFPALRLYEAILQILEPLYYRLRVGRPRSGLDYPSMAYFDHNPFQLYLLDTQTSTVNPPKRFLSYLNPDQLYSWTSLVLEDLISRFSNLSKHSLIVAVLSEILQHTQHRIDRLDSMNSQRYHTQQIRQPTLSMFKKLTLLRTNIISPVNLSLIDITATNIAIRLSESQSYTSLKASIPERLYNMISGYIKFITRDTL